MNAKKCKKVRKQLRSIGVNVREAIGATNSKHKSWFNISKNGGTLTLDAGCGRYQYKRLKARYSGFLAGAF